MYHNNDTWNTVVAGLGFKTDGTRVRRPLSEVCGHVGPRSLLSVRCQQQVWWMLICPGRSPVWRLSFSRSPASFFAPLLQLQAYFLGIWVSSSHRSCFLLRYWFASLISCQFRLSLLIPQSQVMNKELLRRNTLSERLNSSPYFAGGTAGTALWIAYSWFTRLRYGMLS